MLKCLTCPYKLGTIQCVVNPCIKCSQNGQKLHPFVHQADEIHENRQCVYCGSNHFNGDKCADCGRKVR